VGGRPRFDRDLAEAVSQKVATKLVCVDGLNFRRGLESEGRAPPAPILKYPIGKNGQWLKSDV
jgi:hypothetical protein